MYVTRFISCYHVPTPFQPWFTFSAMLASAEPILMSSFMVSSTISFSSYTSTTPYFIFHFLCNVKLPRTYFDVSFHIVFWLPRLHFMCLLHQTSFTFSAMFTSLGLLLKSSFHSTFKYLPSSHMSIPSVIFHLHSNV